MKRTTVDGKTVNERTADMLALWQFKILTDFYVIQGSYNNGVDQSAGTHDGGGAVDISEYGWSDSFTRWAVKQGRLCGFAAWHRPTLPGVWTEHTHAVAIGDPELAPSARAQVTEYYNGGDGLVGTTPDPGPKVKPIPVWPHVPRDQKVNMLVAVTQFKAKKPKAKVSVKRIQWVLNEKLGTKLVCDGVAGPATRAAYKQWEKKVDAKFTDGVPSKGSLNRLGAGRFKVSYVSFEKFRKEQKEHGNKKRQEENEKKNPTFK